MPIITSGGRRFQAASAYSVDQLATFYNQARVDYIVPMPMNGKRMSEYMTLYDIDANASWIALDENGSEQGIIMTGIRGDRGWYTRLGVIPDRRGNYTGQALMERVSDVLRARGIRRGQLEVIEGNDPAYRLFLKLGFAEVRRLLVIRRAPGGFEAAAVPAKVTAIDTSLIPSLLATRSAQPSWVDANESLLNAGGLNGLHITTHDGRSGWLIYRATLLQISHMAFGGDAEDDAEVALALLGALHRQFSTKDTKIENIPMTSPLWTAFRAAGYIESFRRIEMTLTLL